MNFRRIAIEPVSGNLGAIIKGVDLATLDDETLLRFTKLGSNTPLFSFGNKN